MEVLCLVTAEAVVMLDMKEILESEEWNGKGPVRSPPVKRFIKFEEANLPIAMGCFKLENTLYMFGGETLTDDSYTMGGGVMFGFGKLGYDVMMLDLCDPDPHSKPICVGKLKGPKIHPIIFEFKSKIYIFSTMCLDLRYNFEVWDPVTREASSLPPLPSEFGTIRGYVLTERGIVLFVDENERYFFDVDDQIWEFLRKRSKSNGSYSSDFEDLNRLHGVLAPGYNDVYLRYVGDGTLTVNLLEPCFYRAYHWYKSYRALNVEYHIESDMSRIADSREQGLGLGPRYTCALVPCIDYRKSKMRIIIDVLRVDKNASYSSKRLKLEGPLWVPGEELVSVTSLKKQVYEFNFHKLRGLKILPFVTQAFM